MKRRTFIQLGLSTRASLAVGLPASARRAVTSTATAPDQDALRQAFANPPNAAKAWVYWWWIGGYVSREGLCAISIQ